MTHKKLRLSFVAAALACMSGIAYAGYGDDRAFIEDLQARYIINNVVLTIDGNKGRAVAYWTHMTSGADGRGFVDFFGHYEDALVKVNGE